MKTLILSIIIFLSTSMNTFAQKYLFKMYRFECSELYGIDLIKPKGFKVIAGTTLFRVNDEKNIGSSYRMTLESKDKDCLILIPDFYPYEDHNAMAKNMAYGEVEAALNFNTSNEVIDLNPAKYIETIAGENKENYFNADTVFIYKIPLPQPYKNIYKECIGINVIKAGHPSAIIKLLLTGEGKKKEKEFLEILFSSIRYSDTAPEYNEEKRMQTVKKLKSRYPFHHKKYLYHGYAGKKGRK